MARQPRKSADDSRHFVDRTDAHFLADVADRPVSDRGGRVRTHIVGRVIVLKVDGRLSDVVEELDRAIQLALAEGPRGVACDLSAVLEGAEPDAVKALATAGRNVRDWAATPLVIATPDPVLRAALSADPLGGYLIVTDSILSALSAALATPTPVVEWLHLSPHPTAPRASRNFISHTLLDWGLGRSIPSASLVTSELVTNSTMYAGTDIHLSVALGHGAVRLTVRDQSSRLPRQQHLAPDQHGRGLTIVANLSRAFGVLPTGDGGKVVWAVLDVPKAAPADPPTDLANPARRSAVAAGGSTILSKPGVVRIPAT